jgi:putative ABC transport system substrate-binding protein
LGDLGYVEGKNLVLEYRSLEGQIERVPEIVAELALLGVDVIVTTSNPVTVRVKQATTTIPIVMGTSGSFVEAGLVQSLARPGGNVTGLTIDGGPQSEGKRLELLRDTVPQISRVAFIGSKADWEYPIGRAVQHTAQVLGLTLVLAEHPTSAPPNDYAAALAMAAQRKADALFAAAGSPSFTHRRLLADFATKNRLPAVHLSREFVVDGGLMSYGPSLTDLYRRAAGYVDRILRGTKPADLRVEQPTKYELIVNRKAANALDLTIPQSVLLRVDEVIQ